MKKAINEHDRLAAEAAEVDRRANWNSGIKSDNLDGGNGSSTQSLHTDSGTVDACSQTSASSVKEHSMLTECAGSGLDASSEADGGSHSDSGSDWGGDSGNGGD